jgi:hypothetical protein
VLRLQEDSILEVASNVAVIIHGRATLTKVEEL